MMKFAILIFFAAFTLPLVSMEPNITIVEYEKKALTGDGLAMLNLAQHYSEKNNCIIALQWLMRFGVVVIQETTLIEQEKKDSSVVDFNLEKIKNMVNHNKELNKALKEAWKKKYFVPLPKPVIKMAWKIEDCASGLTMAQLGTSKNLVMRK